jgi:hypothetical protein
LTRDPILEQSLYEIFKSDDKVNSYNMLFSKPDNFKELAQEETRPFREYMVTESVLQYKDYFESDGEEQ